MDALRICLLLFLPCFAYSFDSEVTLVKTIGKEPDFTPICTNETSNSGECNLLYRDGGDFVHECDSRFTLKTRNHTVFLHLTSLTPADSGNYSCECSNLFGTSVLHLNITVKDSFSNDNSGDEVWSQSVEKILPSALTATVLLIIIVSCILGLIKRRHPHWWETKSISNEAVCLNSRSRWFYFCSKLEFLSNLKRLFKNWDVWINSAWICCHYRWR